MATTSLFESAVNWIRKGYPEGVPPTDFPPLLALLTKVLDDDQIMHVCMELAAEQGIGTPLTEEQIAGAITKVSDQPPTEYEVNQVASRLAAVGWPLAAETKSSEHDAEDLSSPS
ncbi:MULTISPECIES: DUF3349 domain-containing protein [unclassified Gordonia (in: high G+C Gram-positive bacteria)]|uniref:DUF3349 domain-containing protein n=1 Tax=unclassified Gordonia (in: high G+C Gram-positive bacteria) TaxID=2657482 RepID=UPI0007EBA395|nr:MULTISPECIES: DUF3349 domain-containing protein [unclassified Gordonia (in: high G+C Gram-positive bacteria)]OBA33741.1 hypothetical protein A5766_11640 [Gordonia sp. 852002-51296_SCH5728562-b]OBA68513.1 hypothetical protein A5777_15305 [Gordonia sp. 852002-10350_SCH5691597]